MRDQIIKNYSKILQILSSQDIGIFTHSNKNVRASVATILLNFAIYFISNETIDKSEIKQFLDFLIKFFQSESDEETQFRLITTLGVICCKDITYSLTEVQNNLQVLSSIKPTSKKVKDPLDELIKILNNPSNFKSQVTSPVNSVNVNSVNSNSVNSVGSQSQPQHTPPSFGNLPLGNNPLMNNPLMSNNPLMNGIISNPMVGNNPMGGVDMNLLQKISASPN